LDTALPYLYYFLRLIWSLQNFAAAVTTEDAATNPNVSVEIGHLQVSVSRLKLVPIV